MTMNVNLADLEYVKANQNVKCPGQKSFSLKLSSTHTHKWHNWYTAQPGPIKLVSEDICLHATVSDQKDMWGEKFTNGASACMPRNRRCWGTHSECWTNQLVQWVWLQAAASACRLPSFI